MSDYLTRLATRNREGEDLHPLRPFVRSTSPIAEHDQRVGMTDTDDLERMGAPLDSAVHEDPSRAEGEVTTRNLPDITPAGGKGGETIQRKMAAPGQQEGSSLSMGPSVSPADSSSLPQGIMGSIIPAMPPEAPMGESSLPVGAVEHPNSVRPPETRRGVTLGPPVAASPHESLPPPGLDHPLSRGQISSSLEMAETGSEASIASQIPSREPTGKEGLETDLRTTLHQQGRTGPIAVRTRSMHRLAEGDLPRLEPSARAMADRMGFSLPDAPAGSTPGEESPRIVIGRINVEIVPPPVQQASNAPRPGPMTAASASVIGPLGGSVRPNVRLSLRYR